MGRTDGWKNQRVNKALRNGQLVCCTSHKPNSKIHTRANVNLLYCVVMVWLDTGDLKATAGVEVCLSDLCSHEICNC